MSQSLVISWNIYVDICAYIYTTDDTQKLAGCAYAHTHTQAHKHTHATDETTRMLCSVEGEAKRLPEKRTDH